MAKADDYRRGIENCTVHAELAQSRDVQSIWLQLRDSYEYLLHLETNVIPDVMIELPSRPMRQR